MDPSRLPEASRRRAAELAARSPLEVVTALTSAYLADADGLDEVVDHIRRKAAYNVRNVRGEIAAIERVLAQPQAPDTLARVVGWNGNWVLDDPSDAGAAAFLAQLADHMRAAVAEVEAARRP
jgi:prephenate dehydratase